MIKEEKGYLNRRIRKKKGLLRDQSYNKLKKEIFKEMEERAAVLEQRSKRVLE